MANSLENKIDALVNKIGSLIDEINISRKFGDNNTNGNNFSFKSVDLNNLEKEYQDLQNRIELMREGIKAWDEVSEKELKQRQEHIKNLQDIQEEENKVNEQHLKDIEKLNNDTKESIDRWNEYINNVQNDVTKTQDQKDADIKWAKDNIEYEKNNLEKNLSDLNDVLNKKKKDFEKSRLKEKTKERNRQKNENDYENFKSRTKYGRNKSKIEDLSKKGGHFSKLGEEMKGIKGLKGIGGIVDKFGGGLTKATGALGRMAGPIGAAIAALEILGAAAKAIAETDAKAQEIQNRKNTAFTQHNIALSKIETDQLIDEFSTVAKQGINVLQTEGQLALQAQAIENKKFIAANQIRIGAAVGNINDTAWQALDAMTDIRAEESKYGIQSEKERAKTIQTNAQLQSEMIGRTEKREQEKLMADYELNKEVSKANIEANRLAANHGLSYMANAVVNDETYTNGGKGGMIGEQQDKIGKVNGKDYSNRVSSTTGNSYTAAYATAGAFDFIPGVGDMVNAAVTKQETVINRELTNIGNTLKSQQAGIEQTVQKRDILISNINETSNVLRDNSAEIKKAAIDAATTVEKQYQKMAQTVEQWGLDFQKKAFESGLGKGITDRNQLMQYANIMNANIANLANKFGVKKEDIIAIQNAIQNNTGRNRIANGGELEKLTGLGRLLGDNGTASELVSNTEIFNTSIADSVDMMSEMVNQVNKIGLDGRKYAKDMIKNLKLAQKYDFKNGVKGLYDMSKWAQNVRFNMDSLSNILESNQKGGLEGAITNAAKLQVLGGKFAMGADPLAILYESFMSPEELADRYNSMIDGLGTFNYDTGKVDFNMTEQQQMRAFAEYTGQDIADVRNQASYKIKKEKVGNILEGKGLSDDQKQFAINQSYWDKNTSSWKVKTLTGQEMDLSQVNEKNISDIQPSTFEETVESAMAKTIAWQDKMLGIQESQLATLVLSIGGQEALEKYQSERAKKGQDFFKDNLDELAAKTITNIERANSEFENFLTSPEFKSPQDIANEYLNQINEKASIIQRDLGNIAIKMGLNDTFSLQSALESAQVLKDPNELNVAINGVKTSVDKLQASGFITGITDNGEPIFDPNKMKTLFGENWKDYVKYGQYTQDKLKNRKKTEVPYSSAEIYNMLNAIGNEDDKALFNQNSGAIVKAGDRRYLTEKGIEILNRNNVNPDNYKSHNDAVISGNNKPIISSASKVTPINDGSVQLAKSNPQDTALFAKSGGPFDTLFNGIFAKINDIHNALPKSMEYVMPIEQEGGSRYKDTTNSQNIQIEPVKIELSGKLELSSNGGQTIDIMHELSKNPTLLNTLVQMMSESISKNINGGRATYDGVVPTGRFNNMGF